MCRARCSFPRLAVATANARIASCRIVRFESSFGTTTPNARKQASASEILPCRQASSARSLSFAGSRSVGVAPAKRLDVEHASGR